MRTEYRHQLKVGLESYPLQHVAREPLIRVILQPFFQVVQVEVSGRRSRVVEQFARLLSAIPHISARAGVELVLSDRDRGRLVAPVAVRTSRFEARRVLFRVAEPAPQLSLCVLV